MRDGLNDFLPSRAIARRMHELESELESARAYRRRHSKSPDTTGRWGLEAPAAAQQEEGWFITYLDMMTLLLVVMIVMLAFSGSWNDRVPDAPSGAAVAAAQPPSSAPLVTPGLLTSPAPPPAPAPEPAPAESPAPITLGGDGLLPGGSGLLPGNIDALAVSETLPGWTASWDIPEIDPLPDPAPPLPDDAPALAHGGALPETTHTGSDLYPGWSGADLAASFIGPRLPRPATPAATESQPAASAPAPADDAPSEGEALAAGLSLGELGNDVQVMVNERSVSFRVNSEILFDSSQADLSRSGLSVLRRIITVLADTNHEVTVEGHTDSVPVRRNARYPSNWELSSARAGSVVRYLQANGINRSRLKAVGYADTRPIADNNTPDGRANNRRVELLIEKRD